MASRPSPYPQEYYKFPWLLEGQKSRRPWKGGKNLNHAAHGTCPHYFEYKCSTFILDSESFQRMNIQFDLTSDGLTAFTKESIIEKTYSPGNLP